MGNLTSEATAGFTGLSIEEAEEIYVKGSNGKNKFKKYEKLLTKLKKKKIKLSSDFASYLDIEGEDCSESLLYYEKKKTIITNKGVLSAEYGAPIPLNEIHWTSISKSSKSDPNTGRLLLLINGKSFGTVLAKDAEFIEALIDNLARVARERVPSTIDESEGHFLLADLLSTVSVKEPDLDHAVKVGLRSGLKPDFIEKTLEEMLELRTSKRRLEAIIPLVVGAIFCIGGIAITIYSHDNPSKDGEYYILWGPALFGGIAVLTGLKNLLIGHAPLQDLDLAERWIKA